MLPRHTKHSHLRRVNYGAVVVVTVTVMDLKRVSHVYLFCRLFMCDFCFVFFFLFLFAAVSSVTFNSGEDIDGKVELFHCQRNAIDVKMLSACNSKYPPQSIRHV